MAAADHSLPAYWTGLDQLPDMGEAQFAQWARLIRERTGMTMPRERKSFLVTSVGLRMREVGYRDYEDYYQHLTSGVVGNLEWTTLVDRLTVHETRFFRDPRALDLVVADCLPRIAARSDLCRDQIQIWSAGCATGEEAFTLAMLVDDYLKRSGVDAHYGVMATDISLFSLATARQASYTERRLRDIPESFRDAYCSPEGNSRFQIVNRLRRRVCFAQMNILETVRAPLGLMDIIYCQNLLIYFDRERRAAILRGLIGHLRPGGTLILGAGEMVGWSDPRLERIGAPEILAFRRRDDRNG